MYHLSSKKLETLKPQNPNNYLTSINKEYNGVKRISIAPSIDKCLIGFSDPFLGDKGLELYVYEINTNDCKIKKPTKKEVPDKELSDELWVLTEIKANCIGKIKILPNLQNKHEIGPKYFNNKISCWSGKNEYVSWTWKYDWL